MGVHVSRCTWQFEIEICRVAQIPLLVIFPVQIVPEKNFLVPCGGGL